MSRKCILQLEFDTEFNDLAEVNGMRNVIKNILDINAPCMQYAVTEVSIVDTGGTDETSESLSYRVNRVNEISNGFASVMPDTSQNRVEALSGERRTNEGYQDNTRQSESG
jgi:hypothetical protein